MAQGDYAKCVLLVKRGRNSGILSDEVGRKKNN